MKKIILSLVILAAATLIATPYYIGSKVEQQFRDTHQEAANDAALSGFEIELLDYQRGFLHSTATTRISIIAPEDKERVSLDLHHTVSHLPQPAEQVIATVNSELVLSDEAAAELQQLFDGRSPLSIDTRIYLDGRQEATLYSPSASGLLHGKEAVAVEWQGLAGSVRKSAAQDTIRFNLRLPGLQASPHMEGKVAGSTEPGAEAPESLALRDLRYSGELQRGDSGLWHGTAEGSVANISLSANSPAMPLAMMINSIHMQGDQNESNGLIQAGGAVSANSINFNGMLLSNPVYDIRLENIDAGAMAAWQKTMRAIMKGEVNVENPLEPMAEHIPALFNAHPVLKINDVSVDSPLGRFALKMESRINGEWDEMMRQNPALIIPRLEIALDADLPRTVVVSALQDKIRNTLLQRAAVSETEITPEELEATVNQTVEQQLGGMIAQGFIKQSGGQLQTSLNFTGGKLSVNGIDASPLLGGVLH